MSNRVMENTPKQTLEVVDPSLDTNQITINIHYTRTDGDYTGWNVYAWGAEGLRPQYDFAIDPKQNEATASIVFGNGRIVQGVSFKLRKSAGGNLWVDQGDEIRVDLADVVSGSIDIYPGSDPADRVLEDMVYNNKIVDVQLDYQHNRIRIKTCRPVADQNTAFALVREEAGGTQKVDGTSVTVDGENTYAMTMPQGLTLDLVQLYRYKITFAEQASGKFTDIRYGIGTDTVYATEKFEGQFTYDGDLGAAYGREKTLFRLWAPTAEAVSLRLYSAGSGEEMRGSFPLIRGDRGVWSAEVPGDLNGVYYTYLVKVNGVENEAVDPYARTTGVNGTRGMVIDLSRTEPEKWYSISGPGAYTDAVIYEMHIRDFTQHESSGVSDANRGKYLGVVEPGTTVRGEGKIKTGLDYLKELGVTHVHMLPMYDYATVDETTCDGFNWGYDPLNYNAPEGSYSSDPCHGEVRVRELKQMVNGLHQNGIGVVMDVVYNHVFDAGTFCMNRIVPGYFSRVASNASGCGNDTASERSMVRKFIVDSVVYWAKEYHLDGFRFDLVGLLDVDTINRLVTEVHKLRPDVLFYGEGWDMDNTNREPGTVMARQGNAAQTPGFAYFSDDMRDLLGGRNGETLGFVSGSTGREAEIVDNFKANPWWTKNPTQVVQYASCHDNYTLADKLILSTKAEGITGDVIRMNDLAAAIYMTAQGIPFLHAGEEMLREKLEADGTRRENSYNAPDAVNAIRWERLENPWCEANVEYYKGLIALRKAHPALRMTDAGKIHAGITTHTAAENLVALRIDGAAAKDEDLFVIFNANPAEKTVTLPEGTWKVCVRGSHAGAEPVETVSGTVTVEGISAMVLTHHTETADKSEK